ncbi:hypothetical protein B296_00043661 [Ensete ventricosum]|uniref:Uncharacterized protein n=1 Tax=Ensete ventricosum TaxID=4639 RepID=A0A426YZI6_ENSVE|nr:hypothetical protein B296_00043661 [Ensete ventricosum]
MRTCFALLTVLDSITNDPDSCTQLENELPIKGMQQPLIGITLSSKGPLRLTKYKRDEEVLSRNGKIDESDTTLILAELLHPSKM